MKADQIIKNAKIFTANKDNLQATALVVKDGKFIYVGDEAGLSAYEGEVLTSAASSLCLASLTAMYMSPQVSDSPIWIPGNTSCAPTKRRPWTLWRKA